jgi:hypothetical protein
MGNRTDEFEVHNTLQRMAGQSPKLFISSLKRSSVLFVHRWTANLMWLLRRDIHVKTAILLRHYQQQIPLGLDFGDA